MTATASAAAPVKAPHLGAIEQEQQALFRAIAPTVVFIGAKTGFGSGFVVSTDGLVLTNAHVVGDRKTVDIVLYSGQRVVGQVVEKGSNKFDVALIQTPLRDVPIVDMGGLADIQVGSWVGAIGHGEGAIWTFNSGMVSNIYPDGADRPVFQTQIPINPGNSGGPIFTSTGRVVGIVTSKINDASDLNFGIGLDVARRALKRLAALSDALIVIAPAGVAIFLDGAMVGTGPRAVIDVQPGTEHEISSVIGGKMIRKTARYPDVREVDLTAK